MKNIFLLMASSTILTSCLKLSEAPSKYIEEQSGKWKIEHWEKKTYSAGTETSSTSADDIGTISLNIVNFGYYSEGDYEENVHVESELLIGMALNDVCHDTYVWDCDKHRINFIIGWCDQRYSYTLTLDGWKDRRQTWTFLTTDATGALTMTEVWELKRE